MRTQYYEIHSRSSGVLRALPSELIKAVQIEQSSSSSDAMYRDNARQSDSEHASAELVDVLYKKTCWKRQVGLRFVPQLELIVEAKETEISRINAELMRMEDVTVESTRAVHQALLTFVFHCDPNCGSGKVVQEFTRYEHQIKGACGNVAVKIHPPEERWIPGKYRVGGTVSGNIRDVLKSERVITQTGYKIKKKALSFM